MFRIGRIGTRWAAIVVTALLVSGCASTYLSVWETLGFQRRDLLIARVESARDGAEDAIQAFGRLLDTMGPVAMRRVTVADGSYGELENGYAESRGAAQTVSSRIEEIETVSQGLFIEWERELAEGADSEQRRTEQRELATTRQAYNTLIGQFRSAEVGFSPALITVRDSIRVLQRNRLQAQSVEDQNVLSSLEGDIDRLARELRLAIAVADDFVRRFER